MALEALLPQAAAAIAAYPAAVAAVVVPLAVFLLLRWWRSVTLDLYKIPSVSSHWPFLGAPDGTASELAGILVPLKLQQHDRVPPS